MTKVVEYPSYVDFLKSCDHSPDEYAEAIEKISLELYGTTLESSTVLLRADRRRLRQLRVWIGLLELKEDVSPYQIGDQCRNQLRAFIETVERAVSQYKLKDSSPSYLKIGISALQILRKIEMNLDLTSSRPS